MANAINKDVPNGVILGTSDSQIITNKTIDASLNTISNLDTTMFASGVIDTDISSVSASDDTLASAKAIKTYVDAEIAGVTGGMYYRGTLDGSTNPDISGSSTGNTYIDALGAGNFGVGDFFKISGDGTVSDGTNSIEVKTGDMIVVNKTVAHASIDVTADVDKIDNTESADILRDSDVKDEDDMVSNSAVHVPTQQSVKAYVDNSIASATTQTTEITGATGGAVNNRYIANHATVRVALTLPAVAAAGDFVEILGKGAAGWSIAQNAGQTIHFGTSNTTTGVTGKLESSEQYDVVMAVCITANTDWVVVHSIGNITVT